MGEVDCAKTTAEDTAKSVLQIAGTLYPSGANDLNVTRGAQTKSNRLTTGCKIGASGVGMNSALHCSQIISIA